MEEVRHRYQLAEKRTSSEAWQTGRTADYSKSDAKSVITYVCHYSFSKILEKLIYRRLIKFIENNKILTKHQYGFSDNRSTELAIIELIDRITKTIDKGEYTLGIFLDLSKPFDTINHKILIEKLEHYKRHTRISATLVWKLFD